MTKPILTDTSLIHKPTLKINIICIMLEKNKKPKKKRKVKKKELVQFGGALREALAIKKREVYLQWNKQLGA